MKYVNFSYIVLPWVFFKVIGD